jgi:hypothetical protein
MSVWTQTVLALSGLVTVYCLVRINFVLDDILAALAEKEKP